MQNWNEGTIRRCGIAGIAFLQRYNPIFCMAKAVLQPSTGYYHILDHETRWACYNSSYRYVDGVAIQTLVV
jgi:hypothetical protein